jgi:hypothetical protein
MEILTQKFSQNFLDAILNFFESIGTQFLLKRTKFLDLCNDQGFLYGKSTSRKAQNSWKF